MLAPTRGLSQLATTFIDFQCQGIHHMPLIAWPYYSVCCFQQTMTLDLVNCLVNVILLFMQTLISLFKRTLHGIIFLYLHLEVNGFEPMTYCVQGSRSPNWATPPHVMINNLFSTSCLILNRDCSNWRNLNMFFLMFFLYLVSYYYF